MKKRCKNIKGKAGGKQKNHVGVIIAECGVLSLLYFFLEAADTVNRKAEH